MFPEVLIPELASAFFIFLKTWLGISKKKQKKNSTENLLWELSKRCVSVKCIVGNSMLAAFPGTLLARAASTWRLSSFHAFVSVWNGPTEGASRDHRNAYLALNFLEVEVFLMRTILHVSLIFRVSKHSRKAFMESVLILHLICSAATAQSYGSDMFALCKRGCLAQWV